MQDFDRARQQKSGDANRSTHKAYHIWLSTRDMARVGLLMLRQGIGQGQQVVSREWTRRITSLVTPLNEMNPPELRARNRKQMGLRLYVVGLGRAEFARTFRGAYTGMGAGGQYITVLPKLDMVIAHKTDMGQPPAQGPNERSRNVSLAEYDSVIRMLIARCPGGKCQ